MAGAPSGRRPADVLTNQGRHAKSRLDAEFCSYRDRPASYWRTSSGGRLFTIKSAVLDASSFG